MKKSKRIVALSLGAIWFGVAMGFKECFDSIWMRAGIAAVGGAGVGIMIGLLCGGTGSTREP